MLGEEINAANPSVHGRVPLFEFESSGGDLFREQPAGGVGRSIVTLLGLKDEVTETSLDARDDATLRTVVADLIDRREFGREEFLEPGLLDGRRQGKISCHAAAGLDFIDLGRDQELGVTDGGFTAQFAGAPVHQGAAQRARVEADGEAIREAEQ